MKLLNKQTREIGRIAKTKTDDKEIEIITDTKVYLYKSISEVCEHWEDYEEPKEYWYIDINGEIMSDNVEDDTVKVMREIGNYFETLEEAELAVEKLKAWKRLKDKGFRFNGWSGTQMGSDISYIREAYYDGCTDDMDLLFGGEE